jgi:hypothetical protein
MVIKIMEDEMGRALALTRKMNNAWKIIVEKHKRKKPI